MLQHYVSVLSLLRSNLTTPDIKWLGVRPSDLDRFNIPEQCRLDMTDEDLKTGRKLVRAQLCMCRLVLTPACGYCMRPVLLDGRVQRVAWCK
jgi:hypothetical protein